MKLVNFLRERHVDKVTGVIRDYRRKHSPKIHQQF